MAISQPTAYDELLDLFVDPVFARRILDFKPSPATQTRIDDLLEKNRTTGLTPEEQSELDEFEQIEHFVRLIKARLRQKGKP